MVATTGRVVEGVEGEGGHGALQKVTGGEIPVDAVRPNANGSRQRSRDPQNDLITAVFLGADDGTRTRDPHLGKVMLYQLSHVRVSHRG
jgi:hypothetical protein